MATEPNTPAVKPARRNLFEGLSSWQKLLAILPLGLFLIGGAIGGALGALGGIANVKIAKSSMATPLKAALMIGVALAALVVDLIIAALISSALHG